MNTKYSRKYKKLFVMLVTGILLTMVSLIVMAASSSKPAGDYGTLYGNLDKTNILGARKFTASTSVDNAAPTLYTAMDVYAYPEGTVLGSYSNSVHSSKSMKLNSGWFNRDISAASTHEVRGVNSIVIYLLEENAGSIF